MKQPRPTPQKPNTRRDEAISICITTVDYRQEVLNELPTLQLLLFLLTGRELDKLFPSDGGRHAGHKRDPLKVGRSVLEIYVH